MGDIGIDKWYWRMEEHKRKGHQIIKYPDTDVKPGANRAEVNLFLKGQRVAFWEKHHSIPTNHDLIWWGAEAET
ncbi:MAG: hypothetical protein ABH879_07475 [archaeon]